MILMLELIASAGIAVFLIWQLLRLTENNRPAAEKLCRNRIAGIALALPCALLCVPLAIPVSPGFLLFWLYPLAIALPVLSYFYIDYYASRGFSFFLILSAYDIVHGAFEMHLPGAATVTVIALISGCFGIWLAAQPWLMRDIFRKCAVSGKWKYTAAALAALLLIMSLYVLIIMIYGVIAK